jgi:hypothetical protein
MPLSQSSKQNFLKRRTFEEGRAQVDAARIATQRLYCDVLRLWRRCKESDCKRHRRCCGETELCLTRGLIHVPPSKRLKARAQVIAGGERRIAPATHAEWGIRRCDLRTLLEWK